jgi:hypothetical protein
MKSIELQTTATIKREVSECLSELRKLLSDFVTPQTDLWKHWSRDNIGGWNKPLIFVFCS